MSERFCYQKSLGSCCGCPVVELARQEKMANPDVELAKVGLWVSQSECPPGQSLVMPDDQPRKISSMRYMGR